MTKKIILACFISCVLFLGGRLGYVFFHSDAEKRIHTAKGDNSTFNKFSIDGVRVVLQNSRDETSFSLTADKLVHRKRKTQFFTYNNINEILIVTAHMDVKLSRDNASEEAVAVPVQNEGAVFPVQYIAETLDLFAYDIAENASHFVSGKADENVDILSRILFEDFSLNIGTLNRASLSVVSRHAVINMLQKTMRFSGDVRIENKDGIELFAPQAIWSQEYGGIYFPGGCLYLAENKRKNLKESFFKFDQGYSLVQVSKIPAILYVDPIEEKEADLYSLVAGKIPASIRPFFSVSPGNRRVQ